MSAIERRTTPWGSLVCATCGGVDLSGCICPAGVVLPVTSAMIPVMPLDPDDAKELARLGKRVADYTEQRNAKIREAIAKGAGPREVGRAVGLSHASVINIVTPRKR